MPCVDFVFDGRHSKVTLLTVFGWDGISSSYTPFPSTFLISFALFFIEQ